MNTFKKGIVIALSVALCTVVTQCKSADQTTTQTERPQGNNQQGRRPQGGQQQGGQQQGRGQQGGGTRQTPPSVDQVFAQMDADKNNLLELSEVKGPLKNNFSVIDTDNDGFITKKEMQNAPRPQGQR